MALASIVFWFQTSDYFSSSSDFESYFFQKFFLIETTYLKVNSNVFPLSETSFFYLRLNYEDEVINRKLAHTDSNQIVLSVEIFTLSDGTVLDISKIDVAQLYYYDKLSTRSEKMCDLQLLLKSNREIKKYLGSILEGVSNRTLEAKVSYISNVLKYNEKLGIDREALRNYIDANF